MKTIEALADIIMQADEPARLRKVLLDLARAADTAELLLRNDYPGEAASLRQKVCDARYILGDE